ncbi:HAD-IIIC family phosphatase [Campylobacterota bacterium]
MPLRLEYPYHDTLLAKKKSIKKELLKKENHLSKNIAILGGSTSSEIKNILELYLLKNGIEASFYESEYNKYYEDAVFENPELEAFNPDIIYIHTTQLNIIHTPHTANTIEEIDKLFEKEFSRYKTIWKGLEKYNCAIIQNNFDLPTERTLGNLDSYDPHGKINFINRLNQAFSASAYEMKNLYINDINYLSASIGLEKWFNKSYWYGFKYAVSYDAIPLLAHNISNIINAIYGKTKKCLVLDLDNTCWGGVIGDDGLDNIQIGTETAVAEAYTAFQQYVKDLKDRGITLAVCSKNDFANAKEGFSHPDSILKFEDFTSFKANWDPKFQNVIDIAKEINIGIDSLVFIDDNPAERDIVSSQVPHVSVPDIGDDITQYIDYIDKSGYFEPIALLEDDTQRNKYYEDNKKRLEEEAQYQTYDDFLQSLEMHSEIKAFTPVYLDRITQLTNKTNQFNLTTKRYTFAEIENMSNSENYITLYGKLSDKFGDNGLISIVIAEIKESVCHIDLWLMSCRVLKRGMEEAMLDSLVTEAQRRNIKTIVGYYFKSKKNSMVLDMYEKFGFTKTEQNDEDTTWSLDIQDYEVKQKNIRVNNE